MKNSIRLISRTGYRS